MDYSTFLERKKPTFESKGISVKDSDINQLLFQFQRDIVRWALAKGKAAIFAGTGLGKTIMQLEWGNQVHKATGLDVLILAPLAISSQTVKEGAKFGVTVHLCREQSDARCGVNITNYELLHKFDLSKFGGIVLDESSILKSFSGKTRTSIIEGFRHTPFRLACTATPAPNDHMELCNHAEFLGVMTRAEMLAMFFVHDGGETSKWRIKGHAVETFWIWVANWAVMMQKPSNLGYEDQGFNLPPLTIHQITVEVENSSFTGEALALSDRQQARRESIDERVKICADLVNESDEPWIIWCNMNDESEKLTKSINGSVEIRGSHKPEYKEQTMIEFSNGNVQKLVTKPSIAGFGMNWQHCSKMAFVGLSDSFEQLYQAIRRCWRFGQAKPVDVYIITAKAEGAVVRNIQRKEDDFNAMLDGMIAATQEITKENIKSTIRDEATYETSSVSGPGWELTLGDCVEETKNIPNDSIHYTVFSPPFANLYTYSNSDRDMGNCRNDNEFLQHFEYLVKELYRVTIPGRLLSFHCMELPMMKSKDGVIGLKDLPGMLVKLFQDAGFIYHSKVVIWKDPVVEMQRTKALGLLHKQVKKDSAMCRQGMPDYLITMRKPGENPEKICHTPEEFPVDVWQRYASPVWMDIRQSDTLQRKSARAEQDEKHICPLQLEVIQRGLELWTNIGDTVLDPFNGIGSSGYVAIKMGRKYKGIELKPSYFDQSVANLNAAVEEITGNPKATVFDSFDPDIKPTRGKKKDESVSNKLPEGAENLTIFDVGGAAS